MNKKNLFVAIVLTFSLTVVLFQVLPISSQSAGDYDPWYDVNDDGDINIEDVAGVARKFGASGEPFLIKAGLLNDGGWINITDKCGQYFNFTHNLNCTDIMVEIQGKMTMDGGSHQKYLDLTGYKQGWWRTYGGTDQDSASSMVPTIDGGYAMTGETWSFGAGQSDLWIVKTGRTGDLQWNKTYGGLNVDAGRCIIQTSDGGYAIAGYTYSFGAGNADFWLVKTDNMGNAEWNKTYGGPNDDAAYSIIKTLDGGYAMTGYTKSYGEGSEDFWLVKVDINGNHEWNATYGDTGLDHAYSLLQTAEGNYTIIGRTANYGAGGNDFWLIRTNSTGYPLWNKTYGGPNTEWGQEVIQTSDGGYALTGETWSFGAGNIDMWLVKTDAYGNMTWNQTYGGSNTDHSSSLAQTVDGGYILAGVTNSYGAGNYDGYIVKTTANGSVQWTKTYGGADSDATECSITPTSDGAYAFVGKTQSYGAGSTDFWLIETESELGLAWTDSTADTITLYRGATDPYWNYVRVRIWEMCN